MHLMPSLLIMMHLINWTCALRICVHLCGVCVTCVCADHITAKERKRRTALNRKLLSRTYVRTTIAPGYPVIESLTITPNQYVVQTGATVRMIQVLYKIIWNSY